MKEKDAVRKPITPADADAMLSRLVRFVDKAEKKGMLTVHDREKALFLRTYERLSGRSVAADIQKRLSRGGFLHRIGWFLESLLYGRP